MKKVIGFGLLLLQAIGMILIGLMFWSGPTRTMGDSYAQMAALILGVPASMLSALGLWLLHTYRDTLLNERRDALLLVSTTMMIVTMLATATPFLS